MIDIRKASADISILCKETGEEKKLREELNAFLEEWYSSSPLIALQTSGSTGLPKTILAEKEKMRRSARLTLQTFCLSPGATAFCAMSLSYIAAKMMVVRAIEGSLRLILSPPSSHPLAMDTIPDIDFAAMVPIQIEKSMQNSLERERLSKIKTVIIGGTAIHPTLEEQLTQLPNSIYATYGMTETFSHVAIRRVNGKERSLSFTPLKGVSISLSEKEAITVNAPFLSDTPIVTNDRGILFPDGSFEILGRLDNVINSGGIKLQLEELEQRLLPIVPVPFLLTSAPHSLWGEVLVIVLEGEVELCELTNKIAEKLESKERPKYFETVSSLPKTENGKIVRRPYDNLFTLTPLSYE
ncbi:MAG: AMP-binding protein [Porphyromonas sp.]|nr:AMP-binding protein [Porphyromonas sp.]